MRSSMALEVGCLGHIGIDEHILGWNTIIFASLVHFQAARGAGAARLRAVRMSVLRMRNHAKTLDDAADVVEAMMTHFRAACTRYADAARGVDPDRNGRREEESSESDLEMSYFDVLRVNVYGCNTTPAGGIEVNISDSQN